jgi:CRP-like cAMP-binding protein
MESPTQQPDPLPDRLVVTRAASEDERQAVYRFRYDVYVREMGKVDLAEADHGRRTVRDGLDDGAVLYVARQGGASGRPGPILGTLRTVHGRDAIPRAVHALEEFDHFSAFPPEAFSFTGRLMVAPGGRGGQAMPALVQRAYADGLDGPVEFDFCTCAPGLVDLYEHLGYRRFAGNLADPVLGYMVPLVLVLRDADHLRTIRSPLWRTLRGHPSVPSGGAVAAWLRDTVPTVSVVREWVRQEDLFWRFLADKVRASASGTASILADLDDAAQRQMFRSGTVLDARRGDHIISAGTVGKELFIVLSGVVEVRLPGQTEGVAVLDTGQVFGEIAFIADSRRTADVVAVTDARILVLSRTYLTKLMKIAPDLAARILFNLSRVLCERLVTSNRQRTGEGGGPERGASS